MKKYLSRLCNTWYATDTIAHSKGCDHMSMAFFPRPDSSWPAWLVILYWIVVGLISAGFLVGIAWKSVKIVPRGSAGIRTRNGKPRMKNGEWMSVQAGIYLVVPGTDSIETTLIRDRVSTLELPNTESGGKQYAPYARWIWCVINTPQGLHDAIFRSSELENTGTSFVLCSLAQATEAACGDFDRSAISKTAKRDCRADLRKYGIKTRKLIPVSTPRTWPQVQGDVLGGAGPDDANTAVRKLAAVTSGNTGILESGTGTF